MAAHLVRHRSEKDKLVSMNCPCLGNTSKGISVKMPYLAYWRTCYQYLACKAENPVL